MITIHQRHRQTDRQTTCDRNTALCTKVHRAVIIEEAGHVSSAPKNSSSQKHGNIMSINISLSNEASREAKNSVRDINSAA